MPGHVVVVTDSTACIPPELAAKWGVIVVQQQLRIDEHTDDEGRVSEDDIVDALRGRRPVSTAAPDAGAFFWAYQDAAVRGATAIVSLHVSSRMSKTCLAAKEAAAQTGLPVHVLDSGTLGMSLGYAVLAAARVARAGADIRQVLAIAGVRIARSTELLHVDTLEYLRRGGRIGAAAHLLGTALSMKPMLTMRNGEVTPIERTVGTERALRKLVDRAVSVAGARPVDLAVEHLSADARVPGMLAELRSRLPNVKQVLAVAVTSIITAHVGPGAMGISISPAV